jgi:hypothetical protein
MSYVNLNNPANFQLQEFEQLGFRYIVSGRPTILERHIAPSSY